MKTVAAFKIYNTLSRELEVFQPLHLEVVNIYTCGPTVYDYQHIGNFRSFIFEDVLVRILKEQGYQVKRVMNITDVGHLTSDEDTGEDKLEIGAKREGQTAWEVARKYEQYFLDDFASLNLLPPDSLIRATKMIAQQIALIQVLQSKGFTYQIEDGIYYDSTKFTHYGDLARLDLEGLKAGARVEMVKGKKHPSDFALWKFSPKDIHRDMEWESPWGVGFPGWHLECSTIAMQELGPELDIHCGGVDHIPVHHTNEIAQSEAATGKRFAKYWLHNEFLTVDGRKMSKSLGNFYTLNDLKDKGFKPLDFKMFCYSANYRSKINFTWESLKASQISLARLREAIQEISDFAREDGQQENNNQLRSKSYQQAGQAFESAMLDDMNTPAALAVVWEVIHTNSKIYQEMSNLEKLQFIEIVDSYLGLELFLDKTVPLTNLEIPSLVEELVKQRQQARLIKNWTEADRLRKQIEKEGYTVLDIAKDSYKVQKL
jgi:cysteinyl-tRNA synthetase